MPEAALVFGAGASAGVGGAVCRRLAREGLAVVAVGRTQEKLDKLTAEIRGAGGRASGVVADVTSAAEMARAFDAVEKEAGAPPAIVVYNAGNMAAGPIAEMTDEFFEATWRVCAFGAFLCGREVAKRMVPRGVGTLIFTGATASLRGGAGFANLAVPKFGLRALAQSAARELGPKGIHVAHVIIDGQIESERSRELLNQRGPDSLLPPGAIAESYYQLHRQPRGAWTHELDLRPWVEKF